ncbi:MAG: single-stranded-DNA-specific exonuclease RecJ, partial [Clostridia bacterium]|nr:single-stranded-DNA-specific exonuclease RecJ [Clostridia bacterium]
MARRKWILRNADKSLAKELAYECGINQLSALILCGRGFVDPVDIFEFYDEDLSPQSPFIIPGMVEAVERINKAINNGEKIGVCGDYDADGITASALLYRYLISRGVEVTPYIPERLEEGYGIHISTIDFLKSKGVTLAITVDNGISAYDEVEYAKTQGIDVVITDHHLAGEKIPNAVAVVDPQVNMPEGEFADYSGVGVAFKLVCALEDTDPAEMMERYGDILSIGTVADIVPLKGENRIFVKKGIEILNKGTNLGLCELIQMAGLEGRELTAHNVAFGLSPRINAAGRMGKSFRAFRLLVTEEEREARLLCAEICEDNYLRQSTEAKITAEATEMCLNNPELLYSEIIVVAGENWHQGVLGIVASRLCEKFGKPAVVFSINGDEAVGSARSTEGFNIFDALDSCRHLTTRLGGHKKAAGL